MVDSNIQRLNIPDGKYLVPGDGKGEPLTRLGRSNPRVYTQATVKDGVVVALYGQINKKTLLETTITDPYYLADREKAWGCKVEDLLKIYERPLGHLKDGVYIIPGIREKPTGGRWGLDSTKSEFVVQVKDGKAAGVASQPAKWQGEVGEGVVLFSHDRGDEYLAYQKACEDLWKTSVVELLNPGLEDLSKKETPATTSTPSIVPAQSVAEEPNKTLTQAPQLADGWYRLRGDSGNENLKPTIEYPKGATLKSYLPYVGYVREGKLVATEVCNGPLSLMTSPGTASEEKYLILCAKAWNEQLDLDALDLYPGRTLKNGWYKVRGDATNDGERPTVDSETGQFKDGRKLFWAFIRDQKPVALNAWHPDQNTASREPTEVEITYLKTCETAWKKTLCQNDLVYTESDLNPIAIAVATPTPATPSEPPVASLPVPKLECAKLLDGWYRLNGDGKKGSPEKRQGVYYEKGMGASSPTDRYQYWGFVENNKLIAANLSSSACGNRPFARDVEYLQKCLKIWGDQVDVLREGGIPLSLPEPVLDTTEIVQDGWYLLNGDGIKADGLRLGVYKENDLAGKVGVPTDRHQYYGYVQGNKLIAIEFGGRMNGSYNKKTQMPTQEDKNYLLVCQRIWQDQIKVLTQDKTHAHYHPAAFAKPVEPPKIADDKIFCETDFTDGWHKVGRFRELLLNEKGGSVWGEDKTHWLLVQAGRAAALCTGSERPLVGAQEELQEYLRKCVPVGGCHPKDYIKIADTLVDYDVEDGWHRVWDKHLADVPDAKMPTPEGIRTYYWIKVEARRVVQAIYAESANPNYLPITDPDSQELSVVGARIKILNEALHKWKCRFTLDAKISTPMPTLSVKEVVVEEVKEPVPEPMPPEQTDESEGPGIGMLAGAFLGLVVGVKGIQSLREKAKLAKQEQSVVGRSGK